MDDKSSAHYFITKIMIITFITIISFMISNNIWHNIHNHDDHADTMTMAMTMTSQWHKTHQVHKCSKYEVMAALRLVLCPTLASSSIKACLRCRWSWLMMTIWLSCGLMRISCDILICRAGAMYNISSDQSRQTKSSRAGVFLDIGKVPSHSYLSPLFNQKQILWWVFV